MLRRIARGAIAIAVGLSLVGCAEFSNRGGVLDYFGDRILFRADTKGHRVLRAYVVAAALLAVARKSDDDGVVLGARMFATLEAINDAFVCAYVSTNGCAYFDEKMQRVDSNIMRLALLVLFDDESRDLLVEVRNRISTDVPVFGPAFSGLTRTVQATGDAAKAVQQATEVVENLLRLSFMQVGRASRLAALYRDALEMDMVVVLDFLARECDKKEFNSSGKNRFDLGYQLWDPEKRIPEPTSLACSEFKRGFRIYNEGNGNLKEWRHYLVGLDGVLAFVKPSADHFIAVSHLIYANCMKLTVGGINQSHCIGQREDQKEPPKSFLLFADQINFKKLSNINWTQAANDALSLSRYVNAKMCAPGVTDEKCLAKN